MVAKDSKPTVKIINQHGPMGFSVLVTFIGALVYFCQGVNNFGDVLVAIGEAIVWPGIVLYHVLQLLGA